MALGVVVGLGKGMRALVLLPFIDDVYTPFITNLISNFIGPGMLRNILVGEYGFLIKAIEWPFALILPYVFLFYVVISFLEDSGYLPRIGVLMDAVLKAGNPRWKHDTYSPGLWLCSACHYQYQVCHTRRKGL